MRRLLLCLFVTCWGLALNAFGLETGQLIVDWTALRDGKAGVAVSLEIRPDGRNFEVQASGFRLGDMELPVERIERFGPVLRLSAFHETGSWPDAESQGRAPLSLLVNGKRLKRLGDIPGQRRLYISGASLMGLRSDPDMDLKSALWADYLQATTKVQRQRTNWIATANPGRLAGGWRDLGYVYFRRGLYREAAWCFYKAAQAKPEDALSPAWLARAVRRYAPADRHRLVAVDDFLARRLKAAQTRAQAQSEKFASYQEEQLARIRQLQADFDKTKAKLKALPVSASNETKARQLSRQLGAINARIDKINEEMQDRLSGIDWLSPFIIRQAFRLDVQLAKLDSVNQKKWLKTAKEVAEIPYGRSYNPVGLDRGLRAEALLRLAALSDARARAARQDWEKNPKRRQQEELDEQIRALKQEMEALRPGVDKQIAAIDKTDDMKALLARRSRAKAAYEQARQKLEKARAPLKALKDEIEALRAAGKTDAANAKIPAYNARLEKLEPLRAAVNRAVDKANVADAAYVEAHNRRVKQITAELEAKRKAYNQLVERYNGLEKTLAKSPYRDLVFERDQFIGLAKDELYRGLAAHPGPALKNLLDATDRLIPVAAEETRYFGDRPWCRSINFNCSACFGLAVLNCSFAEMDAQSACARGEKVTIYTKIPGKGGLIGACRGVRLARPEAVRWQSLETTAHAVRISDAEREEYATISEALNEALDPLFDPVCEKPTDPEGEVQDGAGLALDFAQSTLEAIKRAHQRWQAEQARKFRLADMARRLELVRENADIYRDQTVRNLVEKARQNPELLEDAVLQKQLADAIAKRTDHIIKSAIAEGGSRDEWIKKARRISEIVKSSEDMLSKFGVDVPQVKKLRGYGDNALDIIEGGKAGDANKVMGGIRGLTSDVPGPLSAVLEVPGRMVSGHVTHMSDTLRAEAGVMETVAEIISAGGASETQTRKLEQQVREVQDKLTPKSFLRHMFIDPMRDLFKDKVPGGETLLNLFDRLSGDGGKATHGQCPAPPPDFPED